jgi:hypothetical protein
MPFTKTTTTVQNVPVSITMRLGLNPEDRYNTEIVISLPEALAYYAESELKKQLSSILGRFTFYDVDDHTAWYMFGNDYLSEDDVSIINQFFTQFQIKEEDTQDFLKWVRLLSVHKTVDGCFDALLKENKIKDCLDLAEVACGFDRASFGYTMGWDQSSIKQDPRSKLLLANKIQQQGSVELALSTYLDMGVFEDRNIAWRQFTAAENILTLLKKMDKKLEAPLSKALQQYAKDLSQHGYPDFCLRAGDILQQTGQHQLAYQIYDAIKVDETKLLDEKGSFEAERAKYYYGFRFILNAQEKIKENKMTLSAPSLEDKHEPQQLSVEEENLIEITKIAESIFQKRRRKNEFNINDMYTTFEFGWDTLSGLINAFKPFINQAITDCGYREAQARCAIIKLIYAQAFETEEALDQDDSESLTHLKQALGHAIAAKDKDLFNRICNQIVCGSNVAHLTRSKSWVKKYSVQLVSPSAALAGNQAATLYVYLQDDKTIACRTQSSSGLITKQGHGCDEEFAALLTILKQPTPSEVIVRKEMTERLLGVAAKQNIVALFPTNLDDFFGALEVSKEMFENLNQEIHVLQQVYKGSQQKVQPASVSKVSIFNHVMPMAPSKQDEEEKSSMVMGALLNK